MFRAKDRAGSRAAGAALADLLRPRVPVETLGVLALPTQCLLMLDTLRLGGPNRLSAYLRPGPLSLQSLDLTARSRKVPVEALGLLALATQCFLLLDGPITLVFVVWTGSR